MLILIASACRYKIYAGAVTETVGVPHELARLAVDGGLAVHVTARAPVMVFAKNDALSTNANFSFIKL
jgi:hypothetical protein